MTRSNNENDLVKEKDNQERKDNSVINDNDNNNENNDINIIVPNFIRLFVIRRIIEKYIKNNENKKTIFRNELKNVFTDDKKVELLVINIVTLLINDGIKKYMSKYYNEKKQSNTIEDLFNKVILKQFSREYNEIITYGINNDTTNDNYYENLLFNSTDLMSHIFQYLHWGREFDRDLYSCSLVSSHWLYHSWNANSVYHINFYKLAKVDNISKNRKWARIWQRLYNVKSIRINFEEEDSKAAVVAVNKLSMFTKIERVNVYMGGSEEINLSISLVIAIMNRCKDRIKDCRIKIKYNGSSHFEAPIKLPKAQYVEIGDLVFYRQWTNECTQLKLHVVKNISNDWCKFVIDNCDCSNINNLILDRVSFENNSINEETLEPRSNNNDLILDKVTFDSINQETLKQFALKFCNLKTLEIVMCEVDSDVLLFWHLLKPILSKNSTKVTLKVRSLTNKKCSSLSETTDEKHLNLKIDKLIIGYTRNYSIDSAIKFIQERDIGGLNHLAIEYKMPDIQTEKLFDELECKSIKTFELRHNNIACANQLLEWEMIVQKSIFVIIDVWAYHNNYTNEEVLSLFKRLYQNVCQLFLKQIAIDIKITCRRIKDSKVFDSHLSLYSSYFPNIELTSKYNSPKCNNNLCLPRDKPYTYFYIHDSKLEDDYHRYFVFCASNVQMK